MKKHFFLFLSAICCFFNAQAQDTSGYDLKRCISYALENSYLNKSNAIDAEERYSEYRTAKSKILPSIDFYMDYYK